MRDAAEEAVSFVAGRDRQALDEDRALLLAITHLIEIIGEAARHVPEGVGLDNPDIDWKRIVGARDRLIHGYMDVSNDILWDILKRDLPVLAEQLNELLADNPPL